MLVIRLSRTGRRNSPHFRVVVAEKSAPIKGKFVEILGHFDPIQKAFKVAKDRVIYWFENGAQPTQRVAKLLLKYEDLKTVPIIERPERKPRKPAESPVDNQAGGEAKTEDKKEAPATEGSETPAEPAHQDTAEPEQSAVHGTESDAGQGSQEEGRAEKKEEPKAEEAKPEESLSNEADTKEEAPAEEKSEESTEDASKE